MIAIDAPLTLRTHVDSVVCVCSSAPPSFARAFCAFGAINKDARADASRSIPNKPKQNRTAAPPRGGEDKPFAADHCAPPAMAAFEDGFHDHRHDAARRAPPQWIDRAPTPQELLELSHRVYKHSRRLYSEADAQGLRVYHDERLDGSDVRIVMLVPSWFPRPHVSFDSVLPRLRGDTVSVAIVVRGTVRDLVGNTIANLQVRGGGCSVVSCFLGVEG
jgi:hypothetical protein